MNRRATIAVAAVAAATLTVTPALAKPKPKPIKGSWSFTDATPDPSGDAASDDSSHCHGRLPAGPADVNARSITVPRKGTLVVNGSATGDWAMELRDRKGNVVAGDDQNPPKQESVGADLGKGTWTLYFCNLTGAPTATATYTFVFH